MLLFRGFSGFTIMFFFSLYYIMRGFFTLAIKKHQKHFYIFEMVKSYPELVLCRGHF